MKTRWNQIGFSEEKQCRGENFNSPEVIISITLSVINISPLHDCAHKCFAPTLKAIAKSFLKRGKIFMCNHDSGDIDNGNNGKITYGELGFSPRHYFYFF